MHLDPFQWYLLVIFEFSLLDDDGFGLLDNGYTPLLVDYSSR